MRLFLTSMIALAIALPLVGAEGAQTGTGTTCAESLVLYSFEGTSTGQSRVFVQRGTAFAVSADTGLAYVDFYAPGDVWVGWNAGAAEGIVPDNAAYGVMCVGQDPIGLGYPYVPDPTGTWTYQDGL